jgi:hypothetical protein
MYKIICLKAWTGFLIVLCSTQQILAQPTIDNDSVVTINNGKVSLSVDLYGGAYVDFHLHKKPLNPFTWSLLPDQMPHNNHPFVFEGHFLCAGRWGAPSLGEMKAGIPHNGEVNTEKWNVHGIINNSEFQKVIMSCIAPIEQLNVYREITLPKKSGYFFVDEIFHNALPVGRPYNVVQHSTIAPPFLSSKTIINTNAGHGFDQRTLLPYLEDSSFVWPHGELASGNQVDLQKVTQSENYVTSHIFDEPIGWITALNPNEKILMGYVWKVEEYPWLNVWHQTKNGEPYVRGLEFGTTGLGKPYKLLLENNVSFYGRNSFEYIDAGQKIEKSWICFMTKVPVEFVEVSGIKVNGKRIIINDKSSNSEAIIPGNFSEFLK